MNIFRLLLLSSVAYCLTACETKVASASTEDKKNTPCTLEDKVDKDPLRIWGYNDFTVQNIMKQVKDKEGTDWNDDTNDEFRFVFQNKAGLYGRSREGDFIVYKNGAVFKRHKKLQIEGAITTHVDKGNCSYNPWSDLEVTYSNDESEIIKVVSSGSGYYVWYYPDNKTLYQGSFRQFNINGH